MAGEARHIVADCVRYEAGGPGGRVLTGRILGNPNPSPSRVRASLRLVSYSSTGSTNRLAAILYEPGSEWDFQVQAAEAQNRPIYVPLNAPGNPPVAGLPSPPLVHLPGPSTVTTATTTGNPNPTLKPEPGIKPEPGRKPGLGGPGNPWSAWAANFGAEGQGSSWE